MNDEDTASRVREIPFEAGASDSDPNLPDGRALLDDALTLVAAQVRQRPYVSLGVGVGVGWILGHGLPPSLVRLAGEAALRAAVIPNVPPSSS